MNRSLPPQAPATQGLRELFPGPWLICFAVKEERHAFHPNNPFARCVLTGMGRINARAAVRRAIQQSRPGLILSCGFAGALNPALSKGAVLFSDDSHPRLAPFFRETGAVAARFYCADRVAVTIEEKRALHQSTVADAIEMESQPICAISRQEGIPCATLRVILDTAEENLPLDFNKLMTPDCRIDFKKLAWVLLRSPGNIKALVRLQKESRAAAKILGQTLDKLVVV